MLFAVSGALLALSVVAAQWVVGPLLDAHPLLVFGLLALALAIWLFGSAFMLIVHLLAAIFPPEH